ncbi:MBL fold metallo-hydrolase [Leucobacter sp. PH1c]|uniref:MBL fold metallo-hydrolase n=1 Tax=Leucobacter sp. PH1c TaxID=1397278 RepID=UPI0004690F59|nr:MBL fold metallo-hydrolase [Leucobacter sp. PH1c]
MQLTPSLHRIGNDLVAAYLIVQAEGITVVDAGLPGHWGELLATLTELGRSPADLRGLILTHGDSDHLGFAERLRREHGVPLFIHEADAERARGGPKPKTPGQSLRLGPTLGFLGYSARKGGLRTRWITEARELVGGETLDLPGSPRILSIPGHSPGSIAVHAPAADAVFVGDALTTRHVLTGARGAQPAPFTDEPQRALDSLQAIAETGARWVLPGHGAPWDGGAERAVEAVRRAAKEQ